MEENTLKPVRANLIKVLHKGYPSRMVGTIIKPPVSPYNLVDNNGEVHPLNDEFKQAYAIFLDSRQQFIDVLDKLL